MKKSKPVQSHCIKSILAAKNSHILTRSLHQVKGGIIIIEDDADAL